MTNQAGVGGADLVSYLQHEAIMGFYTEPEGYVKTGMSDLQGTWEHLRAAVAESEPFPDCARLLFHIDEGMSWESVRDLDAMNRALLLVRNIAAQSAVPAAIAEAVELVDAAFAEAVEGLGER
jgi:hypothetical protein